jgi:hypothetical protein
MTLLVATTTFALVSCSEMIRPATASPPPAPPSTEATTLPAAHSRLASDPADLGANLVADEQALRDPSSSEDVLMEAARRQQAAYRAVGWHPEWDPIVRSRIPPSLVDVYDRNVDARRQLAALVAGQKDTLPAWRIDPPAPADELLGYYHAAEAATGVDWSYLAAINLIETGFGRIVGASEAAALGPMQFLPATFDAYGDGGDIFSPRDSIMAAARLLAANGFADAHDHAVFRYNHSNLYVRAVDDYAAVLASDPAAFAGYYRWDIYYHTTSGDVLLPIGYVETSRIAVSDYLALHPQ